MYELNPGNTPGLPAGYEIGINTQHDGVTELVLVRVAALLHPWKETNEKYALTYSCGRYGDAYLPVGFSDDDLQEAIQELIWKAKQVEDRVDEMETRFPWFKPVQNRKFTRK